MNIKNKLNRNIKVKGVDLINFVNLDEKDLKMILEWRNDIRVRKWMFDNEIISLNDHLNFIESLKNKSDRAQFLIKKKEKKLGTVNIYNINLKNKRCVGGYYCNPSLINTGVGILLAYLVLVLSFDVLKLHISRGTIIEGNQNSLKLNKLFGYKTEGVYYDYMYDSNENKFKNVVIVSAFDKDWPAKKKEIEDNLLKNLLRE